MDANSDLALPCIIGIAGFPGSGKSYLLSSMKRDEPSLFIIDDFLKDSGTAMCSSAQGLESLVEALKNGRRSAIADIFFTDTSKRAEFEDLVRGRVPHVVIDWIFFQNDPAQCVANLKAIADQRTIAHRIAGIERFKDGYYIPNAGKVIPVYRPLPE